MAFEKLERARNVGSTEPSLSIHGNMSNLNRAFVEKLGLKIGDAVYFDLMYDKDEDKFAIKFFDFTKSPEKCKNASIATKVNKSNNIQFYIKSLLTRARKRVAKCVIPLSKDPESKMYLFTIPANACETIASSEVKRRKKTKVPQLDAEIDEK